MESMLKTQEKDDDKLNRLARKASCGLFFTASEELFLGSMLSRARADGKSAADAARGRKAANMLATANVRLVHKMAKQMYDRYPRGARLEDFDAEGMVGMARAIMTYDDRGYKFSTYATWWIRHYIQRHAYDIARVAHIPDSKVDKIIAVNHDIDAAREQGLRVTGAMLDAILSDNGLAKEDYTKTLSLNLSPLSLEGPAFKADSTTAIADVLDVSESTLSTLGIGRSSPEADSERVETIRAVSTAMSRLTTQEKEAICLMYAEADDRGRKPTQTSARREMGLSKSEFQQVFAMARGKMKAALTELGETRDGGAVR